MSKRVSRGIGWSNESNLLYQILNQLSYLGSIIFSLKPKYTVYTANLTTYQDGGEFQISKTVLDNTIGAINIGFDGIVDSWRQYSISSDGLFTEKTAIFFQNDFDNSSYTAITNISYIDASRISLLVLTGFDISDKTLEIRVYN